MPKSEQGSKADALAQEILKLARNTLLVNLRYLDMALSRLAWEPKAGTIAVDGEKIYYDAKYVLKTYRAQKERITRAYLHMVMHCVFRHNFIHPLRVNKDVWDLACDIAVENSINALSLKCVDDGSRDRQESEIENLRKQVGILTAEKLYRYFLDAAMSETQLQKLSKLFYIDDHIDWYTVELNITVQSVTAAGSGRRGSSSNGEDGTGTSSGASGEEMAQRAADWKSIAERMQVDAEVFSKRRGDSPGDMLQNLQAVNREKYDYATFLRQFAVMGEAMKVNEDEFDYILYTYGLQLYKNLPLIEPLEYKEVKRIREFVIAIDTSGSVMGETVQRFVQKTYNILKQEESYFKKFNLHIIQCDAQIQQDVKITNQEEFDAYLKNMQIHGLGGTDFRPVFAYVEELRKKREFVNLKGMIYLTDGCGAFPEKMPDYNTAFVFIEDNYNNYEVPPWAIKLILQSDEI